MVMLAAISSVSSIRGALLAQYYQQLAREAAESGSAQATLCLQNNNYVASWSNASPLRPNTTCSGGAQCNTGPECYVVKATNYYSTYSVGVVTDPGTGVQTYTVNASVSLTRSSNGASWATFNQSMNVQTGGQVSSKSVVFAYSNWGTTGASFSIVGGDGAMRSVGLNQYGQLGNGTITNATSPTKFNAPTTYPIVAGFANFLSGGNDLVGIDSQGSAFGAGYNNYGQLGVSSATTNIMTPLRVQIPGNTPVVSATLGDITNYYITTDNNVYASGNCFVGLLGNNGGSGCSNVNTPVRVQLPTPSLADPNTIPTTNLVTDRYTTYIRMAGGRVYTWGAGDFGQLSTGNGLRTNYYVPTKVGTYGDSGQPKAVQLATDGATIYILDSTGALKSSGFNQYGQSGNTEGEIYNYPINKCVNFVNDGLTVNFASCTAGGAQIFQYRSDKTFYNALYNKCMKVQADGRTVRQAACTTNNNQKFNYVDSAMYQNVQYSACFNNAYADGVTFEVYPVCDNATYNTEDMRFTNTRLVPFTASGMTGTIKKISSDQASVSVLTTTGEVWSAGLNTAGQFGNGTTSMTVYAPIKFQLPGGVTAVDIYATNSYSATYYVFQNLMVVGSDGKVYGAGSNTYGQLGNGSTASIVSTPVAMNTIDGVTIKANSVEIGGGTAVVFANGNRVYAVGRNNTGQLGDGTTTDRYTPVLNQYVSQYLPVRY